MSETWTGARIRDLGAVTDMPTAAEIMGLSLWSCYQMRRKGTLPFTVLALGRSLRVPTASLLRALDLPVEPPA